MYSHGYLAWYPPPPGWEGWDSRSANYKRSFRICHTEAATLRSVHLGSLDDYLPKLGSQVKEPASDMELVWCVVERAPGSEAKSKPQGRYVEDDN